MTLSFRPYPLQLRHTFTVAGCSRSETPDVLITLAHEGYVGYGEASMPPYLGESIESVCAFLSKVDMEQFKDPFRMDEILAYVDALAPGNCAAKAAIDIALHDLQGRIVGQPLYRLWGLSPERCTYTTFTIGIDTPEVVRQKVLEVEGRFGRLKVKVGVPGDRQLIETIREVSDLPLTVDANQGWSHSPAQAGSQADTQLRIADREHALEEIHWLHEHGVIMVEQPLAKGNLDDLAWLTERSPLPIIADESVQRLADVQRLKGCVSGINIKLMKCTGLAEARKMITVAQSLGMQVMLGCMTETSCAVTAAAQLAPLADYLDLDGNLLIANDPFIGGMKVIGSKVHLGSAPGLGVERLLAVGDNPTLYNYISNEA